MELILIFSIITGQLIKLPLGLGGITLLDLSVVLLLLTAFVKHKFKLKPPPFFIKAGFIFVLVCIISLIFTPLHLTTSEYLNSFFYTLRWSLYLLLAWLTFSYSCITNLSRALQISGFSLAILGIIQLMFLPDLRFLETSGWDPHFYRAASTFLDPNFLGAYLVLAFLSVTQNFVFPKKWKPVFFTIIYLALFFTFSRSSYLMFIASFSVFSFLHRSKKLFITGLILFSGLILGFYVYTQLITTPRGIDRKASASYRLGTWQQGLTIFQKSPVLGTGFNTYRYGIREYNLGSGQFLNAKGSTTNDFSLLYVLATTGIIGLSTYLIFLTIIFKTALSALKRKKGLAILALSFLSGMLIHGFFNNSLFYPFLLIWILLIPAELSG